MAQPLHVLLVDNRETGLDSLGHRLQRTGYRTSVVPNGRVALATARVDPPDLAVLDVPTPDQDGYSTCKELKQLLPQLPVIIYSARTACANDPVSADECGADELICQPADRALVMQSIVRLLSR